jgi:hypothetical protein
MAAAMDVVKNDVPEPLQNLVSENEFAQKAIALLQSAGGQAAMNQPPAMPPTVKQRVDQQAMEGVAGLLQRLAPGMQQRGRQVQQAQARKMIGGGMPAMGAPNMARMADGGIVGYAQGGKPTPTLGAVPPSAVGDEQIKQFAEQYTALQAGLAAATTPEDKAQSQQLMQDLIRDMGNEHAKVMQYIDSTKGFVAPRSQMAGGGIIGYSTGGRAEQQRQAGAAYAARRAEEAEAANLQAARNRKYIELLGQGYTPEQARARASEGADLPYAMLNPEAQGGDVGGIAQAAYRLRNPTPSLIDDTPVGIFEGGMGDPQTDVARTLESITGLQVPSADISSLPRADRLRSPVETAMQQRISVDPEQVRTAEEDRQRALAQAAYQMSPELKAAYAAAKAKDDEYYASQLDPKRLRSQKVDALLTGLAMPGGIARSGIEALKGTTAVDDAVLEMKRQRAVEDFARTKEQAGIEREGRVKAFEAARTSGQSAFERASSGINQAAQSLTQLATSDETRAQAAAVQDYTRQMDALKSQLNVFLQQEKIAADDKKTAARLVSDIRRAQSAKDDTILEIQNSMIVYTPEQKTAAQELIRQAQAEKALLQEDINSLSTKLGIPVRLPAASGASGAIEAADYFK